MNKPNTAFALAFAAAQADAAKWLEENADALSDVQCPEQSYAEREGHEVLGVFSATEEQQQALLDSIIDEMAEVEAGQAEVWEDFSDEETFDCWGYKAQQDVHQLAHWRKAYEREEASVVGTLTVELSPTIKGDNGKGRDFYRDKAGPKSGQVRELVSWYYGDVALVSPEVAPTASRFDAEKFAKHEAKAAKARARHGLSFCYYESNGRVRAALPTTEEAREIKVAKVAKAIRKQPRQTAKMRLMREKAGV